MKKPHESPESSSPIVTRAVAAGLRGELIENYQFPAWQRGLLNFLGLFPQGVGRFAVSRFQSSSGLPPDTLKEFALNDLIQARLDDYSQFHNRFPAITLGAALGGASTYLSLALGGMFLPQAFVITLKHGSYDGDAEEYLNRSDLNYWKSLSCMRNLSRSMSSLEAQSFIWKEAPTGFVTE
jgi:hypothetical protein